MRSVDVLVVGVGPGGASAAALAAGAGLKVLAIDRKPRIGEPVQCAEFIPSPMGGYAREAGVLVQRVQGMKSFLPSGAVESSALPGLMVDRAAFDRALAARAVEAGAEILTDTRLCGLDAHTSTAIIKGSSGETEVRYSALIAADGPHSPVVRYLGLPSLEVVQTRQYTVPLSQPYFDTDIWLSDAYPGGYGWLFPKGDRANVGLGADRRWEADLKTPLDRLHAQLVEQGIVKRDILFRTGGAIPVGGMRAKLYHGNIAFVGDAAGLTHPITGAGVAAAVQSGEATGRAAARMPAGGGTAFAEYDEDMREQYGPSITRALERRAYLANLWKQAAANDDLIQRRGWIAFKEYFA